MRGTLFLIVGPSGAGKDSLIAAARHVLEPVGTHVFPLRTITRPPGDSSEPHIFEDVDAFDAHERAGHFALSWRAHNLSYGVPASIAADLTAEPEVEARLARVVAVTPDIVIVNDGTLDKGAALLLAALQG
ncbi:MAG: hypothetical protein K8S25_04115 [Alphaproteobacteria bacterium]|nr:hypothetical protein [Alphaproteobacteria bacterium]